MSGQLVEYYIDILEFLDQLRDVEEFYMRVCNLRDLIRENDSTYKESYFIACFIQGLKQDIGEFVMQCGPATLQSAYAFAIQWESENEKGENCCATDDMINLEKIDGGKDGLLHNQGDSNVADSIIELQVDDNHFIFTEVPSTNQQYQQPQLHVAALSMDSLVLGSSGWLCDFTKNGASSYASEFLKAQDESVETCRTGIFEIVDTKKVPSDTTAMIIQSNPVLPLYCFNITIKCEIEEIVLPAVAMSVLFTGDDLVDDMFRHSVTVVQGVYFEHASVLKEAHVWHIIRCFAIKDTKLHPPDVLLEIKLAENSIPRARPLFWWYLTRHFNSKPVQIRGRIQGTVVVKVSYVAHVLLGKDWLCLCFGTGVSFQNGALTDILDKGGTSMSLWQKWVHCVSKGINKASISNYIFVSYFTELILESGLMAWLIAWSSTSLYPAVVFSSRHLVSVKWSVEETNDLYVVKLSRLVLVLQLWARAWTWQYLPFVVFLCDVIVVQCIILLTVHQFTKHQFKGSFCPTKFTEWSLIVSVFSVQFQSLWSYCPHLGSDIFVAQYFRGSPSVDLVHPAISQVVTAAWECSLSATGNVTPNIEYWQNSLSGSYCSLLADHIVLSVFKFWPWLEEKTSHKDAVCSSSADYNSVHYSIYDSSLQGFRSVCSTIFAILWHLISIGQTLLYLSWSLEEFSPTQFYTFTEEPTCTVFLWLIAWKRFPLV